MTRTIMRTLRETLIDLKNQDKIHFYRTMFFLLTLAQSSRFNCTMHGISLTRSFSRSPLISNQRIFLSHSIFTKILSPLVYTNNYNRIQLCASSFKQFQSSVVVIEREKNSNYTDMHTDQNGAALAFKSNEAINISGCFFIKNQALQFGGAIYISSFNDIGSITDSHFIKNKAVDGGAIFIAQLKQLKLENCIFTNNFALVGSHISANAYTHCHVIKCEFTNGEAEKDMSIQLYKSTFEECNFYRNAKVVCNFDSTFSSCCFSTTLSKNFIIFNENTTNKINNCCFNSSEEDAFQGHATLEDNQYGNCQQCYYFSPTPVATATLDVKIGSPQIIAIITIVSVTFVGSVIGVLIMRHRWVHNQNDYNQIPEESTSNIHI